MSARSQRWLAPVYGGNAVGLEREDLPLYDSDDESLDLEDVFDTEPAPARRSSARSRNGGRNHRRTIEELLEERMLRGMLDDLEQDFPDL